MKTMKSLVILFMVAALGFTAQAFTGNSDKTENRKIQDFNAVKVSTGIDLYLTMGETVEVKVVADDDIIDQLITEVKDGTLHVYMKKSNWGNWKFNGTRKVYVTVKELTAIGASSVSYTHLRAHE